MLNIPSPDHWEPITFIMCGMFVDIVGVLMLIVDVVISLRHMSYGAVDTMKFRHNLLLDQSELVNLLIKVHQSARTGEDLARPTQVGTNLIDDLTMHQQLILNHSKGVDAETFSQIDKVRSRGALIIFAIIVIVFGLLLQMYGLWNS